MINITLQDNALFLQNWRERMRFPTVVSWTLLTIIIIGLIFLQAILGAEHHSSWDPHARRYVTSIVPWPKTAFTALAYLQGVLLLFFGTLAVDRMAIREKSSGTLEFHRASPTPKFEQFLGLLLGAPSLEWCLFLGTLVVSVLLVPLAKVPPQVFLSFYIGMIFCAVFYHALAILLAFSADRKGVLSQRRFSAVHVLMVLFFFGTGFFYFSGMSVPYHLTWLPLYDQLSLWSQGHKVSADYLQQTRQSLYAFFGFSLPSLVLQVLCMGPLLVLFAIGIIRKISNAEQPVFSKVHAAVLIAYVLFLFMGCVYSWTSLGTPWGYYGNLTSSLAVLFILLVCTLMIIGAVNCTPSKLQFVKGILKAKKLGLTRLDLSDDHSSNILWLATFCLIVAAAFFDFSFALTAPIYEKVMALVGLLLYAVTFASTYEYFQLSRQNRRMAFFVTIFILLWIIFPVLGMILKDKIIGPEGYHALIAPSPFWTLDLFVKILSGEPQLYAMNAVCGVRTAKVSAVYPNVTDIYLGIVILVNILLAAIAVGQAALMRASCRRELSLSQEKKAAEPLK